MMDPDALAQVPLFADLAEQERMALNACLRRRRFRRGEVIFLQGDPGDALYIVKSGRIKISRTSTDGREVILAMLGPATFFGDLALLDGEARSADAVASEVCELRLLRREDFQRFLEGHPRAALVLLAVCSRRLRHNAQLIQDAAFLEIPGRLARLLVELAESEGQKTDEAIVIASPGTQGELAARIVATRESVNKWLHSYERESLIRLERGSIVILDLERLRRWID